ncbi:MAG: hypothetical protein M1827_006478 [Pycnora praestabilis]|nr:MAG: hypothetical protein M1827_006478 [Pycnora praestabilis]
MPMTHGHVLLATRAHREKLTDVTTEEARALGEWLSVLSRVVGRVVGVVDWNVVQNNGARAAQVVPHVHFHIIPRPATNNVPEIKNKSWTMFGRGQREELDDEVAVVLAKNLRREIAIEIGQGLGRKREKL